MSPVPALSSARLSQKVVQNQPHFLLLTAQSSKQGLGRVAEMVRDLLGIVTVQLWKRHTTENIRCGDGPAEVTWCDANSFCVGLPKEKQKEIFKHFSFCLGLLQPSCYLLHRSPSFCGRDEECSPAV